MSGVLRPDAGLRDSAPVDEPDLRVNRRPRIGWWVLSGVVLVLLAMFAHLLVTSSNIQWKVVGQYFFSTQILLGLVRTLELTAVSMVIGVAIGLVMAVMRLSPVAILSSLSWAYTWLFRGTPLLVQIIFWYNLSALIPTLSLGVPFGPTFFSGNVNSIITPFTAALLALGLNEGAYMSEIVRAGILSVDHGQTEAAKALGMSGRRTMRRIILPQAMRVIIPPTGNQVIGLLKSSSLVSVTSLPELLYSAQIIYDRTFQTIPLLVVASLWYLLVTSVLSFGQYYVERYCAKGSARSLPLTPLQKLRRNAGRAHLTLTRSSARS